MHNQKKPSDSRLNKMGVPASNLDGLMKLLARLVLI